MSQTKLMQKNKEFPCKAARRYHNSGGVGKFEWVRLRGSYNKEGKVCFTENYLPLNGRITYTIKIISTGFGDKAIAKVCSKHLPSAYETSNGMDEEGHIILDFKKPIDRHGNFESKVPRLKNSPTDIIHAWHRARFWCWARENNCDPYSQAAWIFFKNSDPSGKESYDWHYEQSQRFERFNEEISVGGYNFTITYVSTEDGLCCLSYCHDGVSYISDDGDGHLFKSGTICLGGNIGGDSGVCDDGYDLEWVIYRSRYWAVAFAYWCEYGNWIDP